MATPNGASLVPSLSLPLTSALLTMLWPMTMVAGATLPSNTLISLSQLSCRLLNTELGLFLFHSEESPVLRKEGSDSPSMATHTSIWSWSQTLEVLETFILCQSRDQGRDGKPCQGTGARTGRAIHTSMARACPSRSQPVMAEPSLATMLCQQTGNLDRPLRVDNFRVF